MMEAMKQIASTLKAIERLLALAVVEAGYNGCEDGDVRTLKGVLDWAEDRGTGIDQGDE
jgi:hypothetical protein